MTGDRWICHDLGPCPLWWRQQCSAGPAARCAAVLSFKFFAFAAMVGDGSVMTWDRARFGGDSSAVQDQLRDAQPF